MRFRFAVIMVAAGLSGVAPAGAAPHRQRPNPAPAAEAKPEKTFPLGNIWVLQSINGKPVTGDAPSFTIDTALRGSGFGGCNTFSMTLYPIRDQKLASGAIAVTRKVCEPATMALEHAVLLALHSLPAWDVSVDNTLSLKTGSNVLLFRNGI